MKPLEMVVVFEWMKVLRNCVCNTHKNLVDSCGMQIKNPAYYYGVLSRIVHTEIKIDRY